MTTPATELKRIQAESSARAREAAQLALEGKHRCRFCKQERPLTEGLVVSWGGSVLFSMCPTCYPGRPLILEERQTSDGRRAVYVGFLRDSDRPADLLVVPDIRSAEAVAATVAQPTKMEF